MAVLARAAPQARHLVVAVSGGADSVALLRLLAETDYRLSVAHLDHQLRDESAADAAFVAELAAQLKLPYYQARIDVAAVARQKGLNLEDAARRLRYSFLARTAKQLQADAIVTAHTQDDQAETVLMQLLRGAALLKGMPVRQGRLLRPLLEVSRQELLAVLAALGQGYREDATNGDTRLTRAWLRCELLPQLEARYPHIKPLLARLGAQQQELADYLQQEAARLIDGDSVALRELKRAHPALRRQVIAELLRGAGQPLRRQAIERLLALLERAEPKRVPLSASHQALVAYGRLQLVPRGVSALPERPVTRASQLPAEVTPEVLERYPQLCYRSRRPGDTIRLAGGQRKLSDLLIDAKIPRELRDRLRLLAAGSEVLWVEGIAADVRFARGQPPSDIAFMRRALAQAERALAAGELPVGAVVVKGGEVIAEAHNETEGACDPSAHAELLALRRAASRLGDWRLAGCTLYVTLEPCPMCFGAMLQAHLPKVVYGADNLREGALGGVASLQRFAWKRRIDVRGGVLAKACGELLSTFFEKRRTSQITSRPMSSKDRSA